MQAAAVAAERGHTVTLLEARDQLGGQLPGASRIRYKHSMGRLAEYLASRLAATGVDARCGVAADARAIRTLNPNVVVVATGPRLVMPDIPGIEAPWVRTAWEVFSAKLRGPEPAVVIGDEGVACEVALMLRERRIEVTLLAPSNQLARDVEPVTRRALLTLLEREGVSVRSGVTVERIAGHQVFGRDAAGSAISLRAGLVVVTPRLDADNSLKMALEAAGLPVHAVGDCVEPGAVGAAIRAATEVAISL